MHEESNGRTTPSNQQRSNNQSASERKTAARTATAFVAAQDLFCLVWGMDCSIECSSNDYCGIYIRRLRACGASESVCIARHPPPRGAPGRCLGTTARCADRTNMHASSNKNDPFVVVERQARQTHPPVAAAATTKQESKEEEGSQLTAIAPQRRRARMAKRSSLSTANGCFLAWRGAAFGARTRST